VLLVALLLLPPALLLILSSLARGLHPRGAERAQLAGLAAAAVRPRGPKVRVLQRVLRAQTLRRIDDEEAADEVEGVAVASEVRDELERRRELIRLV
jgi:hypothetical protein